MQRDVSEEIRIKEDKGDRVHCAKITVSPIRKECRKKRGRKRAYLFGIG